MNKRTEAKIGNNVNPIVIPNAPVPINTRVIPTPILAEVATRVIMGSIFVLNEAIIIDRKRLYVEVEIINAIAISIILSSIVKVLWKKSLVIMNATIQPSIPIATRTKDALMKRLAS